MLIDTVMESPEEADFAADRADDPGTTRTDGKGLLQRGGRSGDREHPVVNG